jgi:REP element-mobilizing transposase RayT
MQIAHEQVYHLYNRSNNKEKLFREPENYRYFMQRYAFHLGPYFDLLAYCLMPTHFHLMIQVKPGIDIRAARNSIGRWQSSYTKAFNKRYERRGNLFQQHAKTKWVDDDSYLLTLASYIHQNPVRAGLAASPADWPFSSFHELTSACINASERHCAAGIGEPDLLRSYAAFTIPKIEARYWI